MRDLTPEQRAAIARNTRTTRAHRSTRCVTIGSDGGAFVYTFNREAGEILHGCKRKMQEICIARS